MNEQWQAIRYEKHPWVRKYDDGHLSRRTRQKIASEYSAALPLKIAVLTLEMDADLVRKLEEVLVNLARFDTLQTVSRYRFPALLLRSESAASSQIEHLTSSIRNLALAELAAEVPKNAQLISSNVDAMRQAFAVSGDLTIEIILAIHETLMRTERMELGGKIREEQVWVGGTNYSPHEATFVPPHHSQLAAYLDDLILFVKRKDLNPIAKAALAHAQFETIHPFIDGNGRTGRTLIHSILLGDGALMTAALPISAGLLHDVNTYLEAIAQYQAGDPLPIVRCVADSLELAVQIAQTVTQKVEEILQGWEERLSERRTASIWKLIYLLPEQPVVDSNYVSSKLAITVRASNNLLAKALAYGILTRLGDQQRNIRYQCEEILEVLEAIADLPSLRRLLAGQS